MIRNLFISIRATLVLAVFTGLLFPFLITGIAQVLFPAQANGSLIEKDGKVIGSTLIAQSFSKPEYFHPRPSAAGSGYAGEASGGTNLGPTSQKLIMGVADDPKTKDVDESYSGIKQLTDQYRKENGMTATQLVPVDAVTRSASGLDPDISEANANLQASRVAQARKVSLETVQKLITENTSTRQFGILGEPRVNVLVLNLELDKAKK